jgi:hypothetical protein
MNGRFGHPGAIGFTAEVERLVPGPYRLIQLLMRQAIMLSRHMPSRSVQLFTDDEIKVLRQETASVPRPLRRMMAADALQNQDQVISLLEQLYGTTETPLTADKIRVMITERAALYADYWEFALRELLWPMHDRCNMAVVANALGMTENEVVEHLKMVCAQRDIERSERALQDAQRSTAAQHSILQACGVNEPGKDPVRDDVVLAFVRDDVPGARTIARSATTLVGT